MENKEKFSQKANTEQLFLILKTTNGRKYKAWLDVE
jgi:hypothetical protein